MGHAHGTTKVVSIRSFRRAECTPAPAITQDRLRFGVELLREQRRILEAVHQFKMDLDKDLSAGAEIEAGELTFDRDLKIVRPRGTSKPRVMQVSTR